MTINLLPVTFKVFEKLFQAGYEMQGRAEALFFLGALAGNILAGQVTHSRGPTVSVKRGLAVGALGFLLLGGAQNWFMAQAGAVLMGAGQVWLTVVYATITAHQFQESRQRVFAALALTMAIGGTLAPLGLGAYVDHAWLERGWPWWIPYAGLTCFYLLTRLTVPSIPEWTPAAANGGDQLPGRRLVLSPSLWLIGLAFTLHGIGQMGAVVWLGRLFAKRLLLSETQVGSMIAVNITGFIAGRVIWARCAESCGWAGGKRRAVGGAVVRERPADVTGGSDLDRFIDAGTEEFGGVGMMLGSDGGWAGEGVEALGDDAWMAEIQLRVMGAVWASALGVAASGGRSRGAASSARAKQMSCRGPTESGAPRWRTSVS